MKLTKNITIEFSVDEMVIMARALSFTMKSTQIKEFKKEFAALSKKVYEAWKDGDPTSNGSD